MSMELVERLEPSPLIIIIYQVVVVPRRKFSREMLHCCFVILCIIIIIIVNNTLAIDCEYGHYIDFSQCTICPKGKYCSTANCQSCTDCPSNTNSTYFGAVACTGTGNQKCPATTGGLSTLFDGCYPCVSGGYNNGSFLNCHCGNGRMYYIGNRPWSSETGWSGGDNYCQDCESGNYCPESAAIYATSYGSGGISCPAGTYSDTGAALCTNTSTTSCPIGTGINYNGNGCIPCKSSSSNSIGGKICTCPGGSYYTGSTCLSCPTNSYCGDNDQNCWGQCQYCLSGTEATYSSLGAYSCTDSLTSYCPIGSGMILGYQGCYSCANDADNTGSSLYCNKIGGCGRGYYYNTTACVKCPTNSYCDSYDCLTSCTSCAVNTYADSEGTLRYLDDTTFIVASIITNFHSCREIMLFELLLLLLFTHTNFPDQALLCALTVNRQRVL